MTNEQLLKIAPTAKKRSINFYAYLQAAMDEFEINTLARQAAFIAQVAHESGGFIYLREIWGPTAAQKGYEGRKDLGNTQPGDGVKFKGRGLIQITGRTNYEITGKALGVDLITHPDMLESEELACRSAGYFWKIKGLNELADANTQDNFIKITKKINGGTNGLPDRLAYWEKAKQNLI